MGLGPGGSHLGTNLSADGQAAREVVNRIKLRGVSWPWGSARLLRSLPYAKAYFDSRSSVTCPGSGRSRTGSGLSSGLPVWGPMGVRLVAS